MKRKIFTSLLCMLLAISFTACSDPGNTSSTVSDSGTSMTSSAASDVSPTPDVSPSPEVSTSSDASTASDASMSAGSLDDYAKAVKDTYAGDYIPDRMLSDQEIEEKLKLNPELYEDIYAEGSTLDENPDIFVAVKAKSGKTAEVESALKAYRDSLASDTAYSANVDKIKAGEVYSNGDHVFLFLLGKNEFVDGAENMADNFANEMKKGVDAIKNMFG